MRAIQHQFLAAVFALGASVLPATASAASDVLLKFGAIQGSDNYQGFPNRIYIDSFSWGLSRSVDLANGKGGTIGLPFSSEVSLVKVLDGSSSDLAAEFLLGQPKNAVISVVQAGAKATVEVVRLELCDAVISSVSSAVSAGGNLEEQLTISLRAFRLTYTEIDPQTGVPNALTPVSWDFLTQTAGSCNVPG